MSEQSGVWVCPNCKRTFRGHVFGEGTSMSGPMCNSCCVSLVPSPAQEREEEEVFAGGKTSRESWMAYQGY